MSVKWLRKVTLLKEADEDPLAVVEVFFLGVLRAICATGRKKKFVLASACFLRVLRRLSGG